MGQLTKGMYGHEFRPTANLFGLRCGQGRGGDTKIGHNNGWYNRAGEKLGWGDLSAEDLQRISSELEDGELFIVLSEQDSFWNFVTHVGIVGSACATKPEVEAPGVEFVATRCRYIVAQHQIYFVDDEDYLPWRRKDHVVGGVPIKVLTRDEAKQFIATGTLPTPTSSTEP